MKFLISSNVVLSGFKLAFPCDRLGSYIAWKSEFPDHYVIIDLENNKMATHNTQLLEFLLIFYKVSATKHLLIANELFVSQTVGLHITQISWC